MKISTMKWIDRWVGYPACALLRFFSLFKKDTPPSKVKRVLVIKFWGMGSLILSLPVFQTLKKVYPDAIVGFATLKRNQQVVEMLSIADQTIYLDLKAGAIKIFWRILRFFVQLHRFQADMVIDLEYLTRFSALASYFSGAKIRVGFHSWDVWRGGLHNIRVPFNPYWHASKNFFNLVAHSAKGEFEFSFNFTLPEDKWAKKRLADKLEQEGISLQDEIIVINPNASTIALERRWPREHFISLINMILKQGLGKVVLIGADDEREFVRSITNQIDDKTNCISLAGKLELKELVELLRGAKLLITNDSGPLHLASLVGTKTVSFFGPETPVLFGPIGKGHIVLYLGIDCSPCITVYNAKTVRCFRSQPECLSKISPEMAFQAVKQALGK